MGVYLFNFPLPTWLPMIFEMYIKFGSRKTYAYWFHRYLTPTPFSHRSITMFLSSNKVYLFSEENHFNSKIQKQPSIGVLIKRCSENMQQLYRRTLMPKCNFNKAAKQLSFCWARFFNIKQSYGTVLITIIGLSNSRRFPVFGSHTWTYQPYMGI